MSTPIADGSSGFWKRFFERLSNVDEALFMTEGELNQRRLSALSDELRRLKDEISALKLAADR